MTLKPHPMEATQQIARLRKELEESKRHNQALVKHISALNGVCDDLCTAGGEIFHGVDDAHKALGTLRDLLAEAVAMAETVMGTTADMHESDGCKFDDEDATGCLACELQEVVGIWLAAAKKMGGVDGAV